MRHSRHIPSSAEAHVPAADTAAHHHHPPVAAALDDTALDNVAGGYSGLAAACRIQVGSILNFYYTDKDGVRRSTAGVVTETRADFTFVVGKCDSSTAPDDFFPHVVSTYEIIY